MAFESLVGFGRGLRHATGWIVRNTATTLLNAYERGSISAGFRELSLVGGLVIFVLFVLPLATRGSAGFGKRRTP